MLLVSTIPKYVDIGPKRLLLLDLTAIKWSKIALHVLSINIIIATGFIVVIAVLKAKIGLLDIGKFTPASKKIMRHCKSDGLNIIHKSGILSVIINV